MPLDLLNPPKHLPTQSARMLQPSRPAGGFEALGSDMRRNRRWTVTRWHVLWVTEEGQFIPAWGLCPYSNASRGNVEVTLKANGHSVRTGGP